VDTKSILCHVQNSEGYGSAGFTVKLYPLLIIYNTLDY
jgi:hypothetical protein